MSLRQNSCALKTKSFVGPLSFPSKTKEAAPTGFPVIPENLPVRAQALRPLPAPASTNPKLRRPFLFQLPRLRFSNPALLSLVLPLQFPNRIRLYPEHQRPLVRPHPPRSPLASERSTTFRLPSLGSLPLPKETSFASLTVSTSTGGEAR